MPDTHQVFISHSSEDKAVANEICQLLESSGISCWIAPRDVPGLLSWPSELFTAIESSKALLLLLSEHSNGSPTVEAEVRAAAESRVPVFPIRISAVEPSKNLRFFLQRHWLDLFPLPWEPKVQKLIRVLDEHLNPGSQAEPPPPRPSRRRKILGIAGIAALALVVAAGLYLWIFRDGTSRPPVSAPPQETPQPESSEDDDSQALRAGSWGLADGGSLAEALQKGGRPELTLSLDGTPLDLVFVRPGSFRMGTPSMEPDRESEETLHQVTIRRPFYMSRYEITQDQFDRVFKGEKGFFHFNQFEGDRNPVEKVSWDEAQEFCQRLSARLGARVRLPTEAEWEYACRAGTSGRFQAGATEEQLGRIAWYLGNAGHETHPVGGKAPNPWGLYDMLGNVREWCQDWYAEGAYATSEAVDPQGPPSGSSRVSRGGGIGSDPRFCRCGYRGYADPGQRDHDRGLRIVVSLQGAS